MTKGVSIVLCTYNGKSRLETTFNHLASQILSVPCELIFVDNASSDGAKAFADTWWKNKRQSKITYQSFEQPIPGKSYAQDLGYAKANYEYLLVCDDDNWLCDTYIQTAFEIMETETEIGALGGWCEAEFEIEKPDWFDAQARFFAVSKQGKKSGDITHKKGCLFGAGMVLRKSHWLELKSLGFEHLLSCRKGDSLSSGGDTEYCYALRLLGYKIWYDERLYFKHFMTAGRLNLSYVSRLRKAMAYSNFVLWAYLDILKNNERQFQNFVREAFKDFPILTLRKLGAVVFGNFEEREVAKLYFRTHRYRLFYFSLFQKNIHLIKNWKLKSKS
tara:strand:+ start:14588 stop:15580 length:993 start_codon:yes stop_codon:yes gene_type:complete